MSSIEKAIERQQEVRQGKEGSALEGAGQGGQAGGKERHHINFTSLKQQGFLVTERGAHQVAEEFRMIKRPLVMNALGRGAVPIERGNLVMVVSALPGEGKTFTILNLAMSIAMERDITVLIVDSDVVKSTLTKLVGLQGQPGLTDYLSDNDNGVQLSDIIVDTDVPKLKIIPAGTSFHHSTELLASTRMREMVEELSHRYNDRIVLFDSPPLLITSQASVLSYPMGQILMVVEAGRTTQSAVREAVDLLENNKVIGMVLNKNPKPLASSYYSDYGRSYVATDQDDSLMPR